MTMLDSMRRHIGWLKWSLGLVILAFAFLYIPDLSNSTQQLTGALTEVVATVGEREITVREFRTVYLRQLQSYQAQSGGEITAEILRSMGLDRQILQQKLAKFFLSRTIQVFFQRGLTQLTYAIRWFLCLPRTIGLEAGLDLLPADPRERFVGVRLGTGKDPVS